MFSILSALFEPAAFTPHGFCLLWQPGLIWVHAVSDALIGLSYFSIPLALLTFLRRRPDVQFGWILWLFATFILACGTTHFLAILTLWVPLYWLEGIVKLLTAVVSVATAILLWPLLPRAVAVPSPAALRLLNQQLNEQIAERDRSAAVLRERDAQLRQAQKMEGLGQLAGGIAHDFNNVLQAVLGGLNLIQHRAADPAAVHELAGMVCQAAERGAAITGRLLSFARKGELQAEPLAARAVLEGSREMLNYTLGNGIAVRAEASSTLPPLLADRAQLDTVLINLAVNARDAMPHGGTMTLAARAETISEAAAHPADLAHGSYICISLSDTGRGMDAATLARAGEPFFTTKPMGEGTGLGLAMARGFAKQSGGGSTIVSEVGQGTTVSLWFPQALELASPIEPQLQPPLGPVTDSSARVLVVDDNAMVATMLAEHLRFRGYVVSQASDGLDALAHFDQGRLFDVLVTDFSMPGMNGLVLIQEARKRVAGLPALLLTGYVDAVVEQLKDDTVVLLRKPVSPNEVLTRMAALLRAD